MSQVDYRRTLGNDTCQVGYGRNPEGAATRPATKGIVAARDKKTRFQAVAAARVEDAAQQFRELRDTLAPSSANFSTTIRFAVFFV
ncbi:MAG: hypothetical protein JSS42_11275 [Proteobacteria bacterium]|uniref:hypothetical protein n=1 Tax=Rudaea sp. TaxID=2136325 RepID=UPI0032202039|nr:hypothetical protein [Pseudomonadota bacterium]